MELQIQDALDYAKTLINIPYRWYVEEKDDMNDGTDKFWCANSPEPSFMDIINNDKSIVCTGLLNLLRRKYNLSIPGLNGNIYGKYQELYRKYPGGTGAWFLYLYQRKRLEKRNHTMKYPKGTLLLAKFRDNEQNQGHVAIVMDEQHLIHARPDVLFANKDKVKNHGSVQIEPLSKMHDYTHVCYPEKWLILD